MTKEEHIQKHLELHHNLDLLIADFITHNDRLLSKTTVLELMIWSAEQTTNPTVPDGLDYDKEEFLW